MRCADTSNKGKMTFIDRQKYFESELETRAQNIINMADDDADNWWHLNQLKTIGTYVCSCNVRLFNCLMTSNIRIEDVYGTRRN